MAEPSNPRAPRLLFIEDHEATRDALARLLCSEGFIVEPASNGAAGVALARDRTHDAILLDLRLPDIPGLQVLSELRCRGVFVPCVILTGFPGIQSSLEAGRLGAVSYLEKPALATELVAALRAAVQTSFAPTQLFAPRPVTGPPLTKVIVESMDRCASRRICADLARSLAKAVDHPSATICQFVEMSAGLRTLSQCDGQRRLTDVMESIRWSFEQAAKRDLVATSANADRILHRLETSGRALRTIRQDELAVNLGLTPRYLEQVLDDDFGLTFSACRLSVLMRKAVCELAGGREHVRQVAFHAGYEDHGNFDRSFRSFFGVTPTLFRKLREER